MQQSHNTKARRISKDNCGRAPQIVSSASAKSKIATPEHGMQQKQHEVLALARH